MFTSKRSEWLFVEDDDPSNEEVGEWLLDKWLELKKEFWPIKVLLLLEATPIKTLILLNNEIHK